VNCT